MYFLSRRRSESSNREGEKEGSKSRRLKVPRCPTRVAIGSGNRCSAVQTRSQRTSRPYEASACVNVFVYLF